MPHDSPRLLWSKSDRGAWLKLADIDLRAVATFGVFVIWHGGFPSRVVRVGHGDVASELLRCRHDPDVLAHERGGPLFVTWAGVDASFAAGIARYLEDRLRPLVAGDDVSLAGPIAANSPF